MTDSVDWVVAGCIVLVVFSAIILSPEKSLKSGRLRFENLVEYIKTIDWSSRNRSVVYESLPQVTMTLFSWFIVGDGMAAPSLAALICLAIRLARYPYNEMGRNSDDRPHLESDEMKHHKGKRLWHESREVVFVWGVSVLAIAGVRAMHSLVS